MKLASWTRLEKQQHSNLPCIWTKTIHDCWREGINPHWKITSPHTCSNHQSFCYICCLTWAYHLTSLLRIYTSTPCHIMTCINHLIYVFRLHFWLGRLFWDNFTIECQKKLFDIKGPTTDQMNNRDTLLYITRIAPDSFVDREHLEDLLRS